MTENKRFILTDFDTEVEMLELLNIQAEVISDLSEQNEELKIKFNNCNTSYWKLIDENKKLKEENEQLKEEIAKFKEEEKHIGDVKREDLDRVFKMSIYEIAEAFEYYRKKIKELSE